MTIRAIILGITLGLFVSAATYFNDNVVRQTMLIGNHLPISVFGFAVLLLLAVNPLLRVAGPKWALGGGEIAIIVALGLAACGWPGSGYFRGFDTITGLPAHWQKTKANWSAANVMSYVPGGSAEMAMGHVQSWPVVLAWLQSAGESGAGAAERAVWSRLSEETRLQLGRIPADARSRLELADRERLLRSLNADLIEPVGEAGLVAALSAAGVSPEGIGPAMAERERLLAAAAERDAAREASAGDAERAEHLRQEGDYLRRQAADAERLAARLALVSLWDGAVLPPPEGRELLLSGGRADPWAVDTLVQGRPESVSWSLRELPWLAWAPVMRTWWAPMLLLGVAALCLTLIVHPQWSRRELLPYPIARFVEEATERAPTAWLPTVATTKAFWIPFVLILALHSVNGMHLWEVAIGTFRIPQIPLTFDFAGINQLFPNAARISGFSSYSQPRLFPSVIAFSFFLTASVSFSLGVSQAMFLAFGAFLVTQGTLLERDYAGAKSYNMLLFGAYVGMAMIILYTGRRYYANVVVSAVGGPRGKETPGYATWAARALGVVFIAAVVAMKWTGLDWGMACVFVLIALLIFVVMTRIVVETGAFFMQPTWLPVGVLTALFGFEAIGPTTYIVLGIASMLMVVDPREVIMPYLANGLQIAERSAGVGPSRVAPWMLVVVVAGFFVAGTATLYWQYNKGLAAVDNWTKESLPTMAFDNLARFSSEAAAAGTLAEATAVGPMERLAAFDPLPGAVPWMLLGLGLTVATAAARLRLPWWPLHPVAFLVWGTYPINQFAFSFLLGWMVKAGVMRTMGAKGYHQVKPVMIGVIAGELTAGLLWMAVGASYYWLNNKPPVNYSIFPG